LPDKTTVLIGLLVYLAAVSFLLGVIGVEMQSTNTQFDDVTEYQGNPLNEINNSLGAGTVIAQPISQARSVFQSIIGIIFFQITFSNNFFGSAILIFMFFWVPAIWAMIIIASYFLFGG